MASISILPPYEPEEDVVHNQDDDHDLNMTLDFLPCWSSDTDLTHQDDAASLPDSLIIGDADLLDFVDGRENQANFVIDLFHQRVEQSQVMSNNIPNSDNDSNNNVNASSKFDDINLIDLDSDALTESGFGVVEGNHEPDLGLRVGLGFDSMESHDSDAEVSIAGVDDYGDDFFVERRVSRMSATEAVDTLNGIVSNGNIEIFRSDTEGDGVAIGLNLRYDTEEDEENTNGDGVLAIDLNCRYDYGIGDVNNGYDDDDDDDDVSVNIPLCWDSLQLEDRRDINEDFEWEEVDDRADERDNFSVFLDAEDDMNSVSFSVSHYIAPEQAVEDGVDLERAAGLGNLEWEVLLNANNLETNPEMGENVEPLSLDRDDYIYTSEYEMLFGQFTDNENAFVMRPPASKSVVEKLSSVVVTQEDVENSNCLCAVCKDEVNLGEMMKQLPCSHRYHRDCIIPWLGIRNTCPLCRHELPTDDAEYEKRKSLRASGALQR